jgi:Apea-like HEPN
MTEPAAKEELRALVRAALERIHASGEGIEGSRGVALYDLGKDEIFTSLNEFSPAETAVASLPLMQERYGANEAQRVTLEFIYQMLERISEPAFDEATFEALWEDFVGELDEPEWVFRAVANVRYFGAEGGPFEFGDGVSIRGRSPDELRELGFSEYDLRRLADDWAGHGASSYIMLVEDRVEKAPDNFIQGTLGTEFTKSQRVLGALRLLAPGDVGIGRMWTARPARFNVGIGGSTMLGFTIPTMGSSYVLTDSLADAVPGMYNDLRQLEQEGYGSAPGNLDLALRSFMATYDRWPSSRDSQVRDAITAIEAVLGSRTEIAFKLAFRVAGILADDDAQRVQLFDDMKGYYDLRSRLVHGEALRERHRVLLEDVEPLREFVRRLLRGFIRLAISSDHAYDKRFFQERLDASLQEEMARSGLRRALGFI